jgi:probable HAF family extracellular repeat protein
MKRLITATLGAVALLLAAGAQGAGQATGTTAGALTYQVKVLPSLGGTESSGNSINNRGWVAGYSNLTGDETRHAVLWRNGQLTDLRTLGGPNSAVLWPVKNNSGIVAGVSQTAAPAPFGETWSCRVFFPAPTRIGHQCVGFVWRDGVMRALPTFAGGNTNGFATGVNNRGQVVGWAENAVHDPTCVSPQVLQFRAAMWDAGSQSIIRELPPLPGDTVSAATAINDRGQVVGISGFCDIAVGEFSAIHPVLWQNGKPISLGTIGGVAWNTPMAIDERGDVVGFANHSAADGGNFAVHAFLWTRRGGMQDLGTLPAPFDATSQALGINERGDIVGTSCDPDFNCRAVLWHDGAVVDLNSIAATDGAVLTTANDVDEAGRITGQAADASGTLVAFVARP